MKKTLIPISILGAAGLFALRWLQLEKSYDGSGLIPRGDKLSLALYLVCALAAALILVICLRERKGVQSPAGKSRLRGILVFLAGLALLGSYLPPALEGGLRMVVPILAFAAACAISIEGMYHMGGATGALLGGCILPVYLAASLISNYRSWSHDPIVADFCFPLLFLVAAMLASYHLAAFRVGRGKRRTTAFFVGCAILFAGPVLVKGDWRTVVRTLAVSLYLIAEFWPYTAKPDPLPELEEDKSGEEGPEAPEPAEQDLPDAPEPAEQDLPDAPEPAEQDLPDAPEPAEQDLPDAPEPAAETVPDNAEE